MLRSKISWDLFKQGMLITVIHRFTRISTINPCSQRSRISRKTLTLPHFEENFNAPALNDENNNFNNDKKMIWLN